MNAPVQIRHHGTPEQIAEFAVVAVPSETPDLDQLTDILERMREAGWVE